MGTAGGVKRYVHLVGGAPMATRPEGTIADAYPAANPINAVSSRYRIIRSIRSNPVTFRKASR